jgi:hypothetical protein
MRKTVNFPAFYNASVHFSDFEARKFVMPLPKFMVSSARRTADARNLQVPAAFSMQQVLSHFMISMLHFDYLIGECSYA